LNNTPVLFLPGTLCDDAIFTRQISAFEATATSVKVVPFKHERSIQDMAETVVRQIPPGGKACIAGFSMGGMVALALAAGFPERVSGLALINSNCHADFPGSHSARLRHLELAGKDGIREMMVKHYLPRYLHLHDPVHRHIILEMAQRLGTDCFEAQAEALATRPDASEVLRRIHCPTLILGSDQDLLCPPAEQLDMHRLAAGSDLLMLGACGHFSMLERPEAVSSALLNWHREQCRH
jgi:pimeloyl-ACP methyl ester carboxylesterase